MWEEKVFGPASDIGQGLGCDTSYLFNNITDYYCDKETIRETYCESDATMSENKRRKLTNVYEEEEMDFSGAESNDSSTLRESDQMENESETEQGSATGSHHLETTGEMEQDSTLGSSTLKEPSQIEIADETECFSTMGSLQLEIADETEHGSTAGSLQMDHRVRADHVENHQEMSEDGSSLAPETHSQSQLIDEQIDITEPLDQSDTLSWAEQVEEEFNDRIMNELYAQPEQEDIVRTEQEPEDTDAVHAENTSEITSEDYDGVVSTSMVEPSSLSGSDDSETETDESVTSENAEEVEEINTNDPISCLVAKRPTIRDIERGQFHRCVRPRNQQNNHYARYLKKMGEDAPRREKHVSPESKNQTERMETRKLYLRTRKNYLRNEIFAEDIESPIVVIRSKALEKMGNRKQERHKLHLKEVREVIERIDTTALRLYELQSLLKAADATSVSAQIRALAIEALVQHDDGYRHYMYHIALHWERFLRNKLFIYDKLHRNESHEYIALCNICVILSGAIKFGKKHPYIVRWRPVALGRQDLETLYKQAGEKLREHQRLASVQDAVQETERSEPRQESPASPELMDEWSLASSDGSSTLVDGGTPQPQDSGPADSLAPTSTEASFADLTEEEFARLLTADSVRMAVDSQPAQPNS